MICENPFMRGLAAFPCGKCPTCRMYLRRQWTHRYLLEAALHGESAFVGLTYNDETVPLMEGSGLFTLEPRHLQLFMKRLRRAFAPEKFRFAAVGEYGDQTFRPHYHAILFGFPSCERGHTLREPATRNRPLWRKCCERCRMVGEAWNYADVAGDVDLGTVEVRSARYLGGYIEKKMTRSDDPRLGNRYPEFARRSNRPGIGFHALWEVASVMMQYELDDTAVDVPLGLNHGQKCLPLGRYLRGKLRELIGREKTAPLQDVSWEMLDVYLAAIADKEDPSFKSHLVRSTSQKRENILNRAKLYSSKRPL